MTVKVLVVDDSSFFRRRISKIINSDSRLEVIGNAVNGKEAVALTQELHPNVVVMDIEMPVMDGITAVREIMKVAPTPILMFSSLSHEGAKVTLDALDAGAMDFLPKRFEDIAQNREEAVELLLKRIRKLGRSRMGRRSPTRTLQHSTGNIREVLKPKPVEREKPSAMPLGTVSATPLHRPAVSPSASFKASGKKYQLMAIGTSTGGPVALQKVLTGLPANFPHPIVMIQHMPATFTAAFAARLNNLCKLTVKEAQDGDTLRAGIAYLAPGGKQMMLEGRPGSVRIRILDGGERMNYKPCVDVTFGSAAKIYNDKVLSMVLTGMGADGREGARMLKERGSTIWAQDEESCVVYGMPQAVAKAGISSEDLPLNRIAERILVEVGLS